MEDRRVLGAQLREQQVPLAGPAVHLGETTSHPSLRLWLVGQHVDLHARCHELMATDQAPFWAFCWASGQALARFVTAHPERVRGKHVVDFGAGSGVAGISAALAGARTVTAVDSDPAALEACKHNAALNGVELQTSTALPSHCDVLLAADVLYDETGPALLAMLRGQAGTVLLADPGRPSSPDLPGSPAATYELTTLPDVDPPMRHAAVYIFAENSKGAPRRCEA